MATVSIVFARAMDGMSPVIGAIPESATALTSTGVSQASSNTAGNGVACSITTTGNIWVKFGAGTPVAAPGADYLILSGSTRDFGNIPAGYKAAVIDAV